MGKKKAENYLDYVPVINSKNNWDETEGMVTIHMVHRGVYAKIAQKVFHTPRVSNIDLDPYGSFLWQQIDGQRSVAQLAQIMSRQFGKDAEPLYNRLVKYIQILRNNRFIFIQGRDKVAG